jgi:hypothetical protein
MNTEMNNNMNNNMNMNNMNNNMGNSKPKVTILIIVGALVLLAAGILIGKFLLTTPESNKQENSNVTDNENTTDNEDTEEETTEEAKLTVTEATLIISTARNTDDSYINNVVLTENCSKDNSAYSVSYDVHYLNNSEFDPDVGVKTVCVLVKENGEWVTKFLDSSGFTPEIAKYDLMCD